MPGTGPRRPITGVPGGTSPVLPSSRVLLPPRGDAYYATTWERVDHGLRTGDPPLESDWPDIIRGHQEHELVFFLILSRKGGGGGYILF